MRKQVYLNQQTIEQLDALTTVAGDESHVLQLAIHMLFQHYFPHAEAASDPELRETLLEIHQLPQSASTGAVQAQPILKEVAGQMYKKFHYGNFYTVEDQGRTRALEGRFCEEIIFPVAERFAEHGGEWKYHFDEKSGFLHGVATVDGEEIPEGGTNGWYAMVMHLERIDPEIAQQLPHDPHPDYGA